MKATSVRHIPRHSVMCVILQVPGYGLRMAEIGSMHAVMVERAGKSETDILMNGRWFDEENGFLGLSVSAYPVFAQNSKFTDGMFEALYRKSLGYRPITNESGSAA